MNRKELVNAVAAQTGLEPRDVDKALRGTTEVIEAVAAKGEQVTISGFAKFARVDRPARMARKSRQWRPGEGEGVEESQDHAAQGLPGRRDEHVGGAEARPRGVATTSQGGRQEGPRRRWPGDKDCGNEGPGRP